MSEAEASGEDVAEPDRLSTVIHALPWVLAIAAILALGYWWGATSRPGKRTDSDWWTDLPDSGVVINNESWEPLAVRMFFAHDESFATSLEPYEEVVTEIEPEPRTWLRIELSRDPSMLTDADEVPPFRGDYYLPESPDEGYLLRVRVDPMGYASLSVAGAVRERNGQRSRRVQSFGYPHWGVFVRSNASNSTLMRVRFELGEARVGVGELPPGAKYVWCPARSKLTARKAMLCYGLTDEPKRWAYRDGAPGFGSLSSPPIWEFWIPHW